MIVLTADQLRQRFLDFFAAHGHKIYPSDTLVPKDDPTLLFTSAGMNQFKPEFLGRPTRFKRRATAQRCLRTDDLDKVGQTSAHHTFFEMLGNFSFGDYFKEEAIVLAWEFVTADLGLPKADLWISVYRDDAEAHSIWQRKVNLSKDKIVRLGAKENFWPANAPADGPNGPCGPCSEIFYDHGVGVGCGRSRCSPACNCGRFVEVWNLVFTQFERKGKNDLRPLPHKNIDTGMGLERMAAVLQGVANNFEIDIFRPITKEIERASCSETSRRSARQYRARNAIADHIRAITVAIADGIFPSNDARGYVIRKLIRRAAWHGRSLGIERPYLYRIVPGVTRVMQGAYPQLVKKREEIARVVLAEERRFHQTLVRAMTFADELIARLRGRGETQLPAEIAFKLYDTYGLPLEMLEVLAQSRGLQLDSRGFCRQLERQRKSSRQASAIESSVFVGTLVSRYKLKPTKFVGEHKYRSRAKVQALFKQGRLVKQAARGEEIKIVLDTTPFYGEAGGQIGDSGRLKNKNTHIKVLEAQKIDQTIVHLGRVVAGRLRVGDSVEARIELARRQDIARNHTATHLLQGALRRVLGEHVRQAGSWVGADRLRFDFSHYQALTPQELARVEGLVRDKIEEDIRLEVAQMSFARSQAKGALAFFGDKYQEQVRVVQISDFSQELCGGTHVASTAEIGRFKIIAESAVASGIRRIEAITGSRAKEYCQQREAQLQALARGLGCAPEQLPEAIVAFWERIKRLDKKLDQVRLKNFKSRIEEVIAQSACVSGVKIIAREIKGVEMRLLRLMADLLRQQLSAAVIILVSVWEEKVLLVCALSKGLETQGLNAAEIARWAAQDLGGSGGGRWDFAQAGGRNPTATKKALAKATAMVKKRLSDLPHLRAGGKS